MKKIFLSLLLLGLLSWCSTPDNINISKVYPNEVIKWDIFDIVLTIENIDSKDHKLKLIDIDDDFLDGILISDVNIKILNEYSIFWMHTYEFEKNITQKSNIEVILSAKAVKKWDFSGDLDFCIDSDTSCIFNSIRILVN